MIIVVPARAGSERLPGKNFKKFGNTTLINLAVAQAVKTQLSVIVSTDNDKWTSKVSVGVTVVRRPELLSGSSVSTWDVVEHAAYMLGYFGTFCLLQPTSPLRTLEDIRSCVDLALKHGQNVTSVHKGTPNGAIYIRRWKTWNDIGIQYSMPWIRSCDIDTEDDFVAAENLLAVKYAKGIMEAQVETPDTSTPT